MDAGVNPTCRPTPRSGLPLMILGTTVLAIGCHAPGTSQNIDGVRMFQQGQSQAAIQQFQQSLAANPMNADSYYNLAASYHYVGKQNGDPNALTQAESLYHQCLDLNPDHVACHRGLAVLLVDTNRPQSAFTLLERWAVRSPQIADSRIELARLHEEFGESEAAQRYLAEAIDVQPGNPRAWLALGKLREDQGQYAQALSNYQQAYYLNGNQPAVAQHMAALQQQLAAGGGTPPNGNQLVETPRGWTRR